MINFELKRISEDSPFYNITLYKDVNKRNGTLGTGIKDKIYSTKFENAINLIAHIKTQDELEDRNVSLKEYLSSFYKNWNNYEDC